MFINQDNTTLGKTCIEQNISSKKFRVMVYEWAHWKLTLFYFSLSAGFLNDREMQDLLSRMLDVTGRRMLMHATTTARYQRKHIKTSINN